ncbi:hypothetical protein [Amycolatopsis antarctica]|uniref:hypothetical protein n=1 Tax=Amycolatopsis antarctica TaxID=1854586 RepID=UPI001F0ADCAF|nr:hypothetical protein [Amycolatopsis antarctica]
MSSFPLHGREVRNLVTMTLGDAARIDDEVVIPRFARGVMPDHDLVVDLVHRTGVDGCF